MHETRTTGQAANQAAPTSTTSNPDTLCVKCKAARAASYVTGEVVEVKPDNPWSRTHRMTISVWRVCAECSRTVKP